MRNKFLHTLIVNVFVSLALQASPVQFQEPKPQTAHSQIVVFDGEKKILLPDGRIIPFGQSTICTDEKCIAPELPASRSKAWLVLPVAAVALAAILWRTDIPCVIPRRVPELPPAYTRPPTADVPEPVTLLLLGFGLAILAVPLRRRICPKRLK